MRKVSKALVGAAGAGALLAGALGVPAALAADGYQPTANDECGVENDTFVFPTTYVKNDGTTFKVAYVGYEGVFKPTGVVDASSGDVRALAGKSINLKLYDAQSQSLATYGVPVDMPELTNEPCTVESEDEGEEASAVDWDTVPAVVDGKTVLSMEFENAAGTTFTLTPGLAIEEGSKLIKINFADVDDQTEAEEPEASETEPTNDDTCIPTEIDVDWDEVPAVHNGKDVESMRFVNKAGTEFTLTTGLAIEEGSKLISITYADGTTWNACVVPDDPSEDVTDESSDATEASDATDEASSNPTAEPTTTAAEANESGKLAKTGTSAGVLGALAAALAVAGAGALVVRRKMA